MSGPSDPTITASPTDEGSDPVDLSPFSLLYETDESRQASRRELAEVADATRLYLEDFMFEEFSQTTLSFLDDFVTRMETSTFLMDMPYVIDYSATARLNPFSIMPVPKEVLDEALQLAFTGSNMRDYELRLEGLPENNVFHGATCFFGEPVVRISQKPSNGNAATIAALSSVV